MRKAKAKRTGNGKTGTKWAALRCGAGTVAGYLELFWSKSLGKYASVPGVSRWKSADGKVLEIEATLAELRG